MDPKKRPVARHIISRLDKSASTIETGISTSSVELEQHISFLKNIKEHAETEDVAEYVGGDHWQQGQDEAPGDQWGAQETQRNVGPDNPQGASTSSSKSGVFYKLNNFDIFNSKSRKNYVRNGGPMLEKIYGLKLYKQRELKPILKDHNLIGRCGFGEVYKGLVRNVPVIVRKLSSGAMLENKQFENKVIMQWQMRHRNIVRLIGCCLEADVPMLVYEFLFKGSLHDILHSNKKVPLKLGMRLNIVVASASALGYMHSAGSEEFLHGDFKPTSVLFDDSFVPKISDFGLSSMIARGYKPSDISYMDPVYLQTGLLTEQSDVYSFGVVLLELITRKKATHSDNNALVRIFLENHKKGMKSTELFDKEIAVVGDLELLDNLAGIAVECLNLNADLRPTMMDVGKRLSILNLSYNL